ncbi:hypothetical protein AOLI_G00221730 [Acnodon oligacanthus]
MFNVTDGFVSDHHGVSNVTVRAESRSLPCCRLFTSTVMQTQLNVGDDTYTIALPSQNSFSPVLPLCRVLNPHKPFFSPSASLSLQLWTWELGERTVRAEQAEKSSDSGVEVAGAGESAGQQPG